MTKLLEKAFAEASKLPVAEQNILARLLLEDLESEEKWDETFADSGVELAALADEALAEHRNGKTRELKDVL